MKFNCPACNLNSDPDFDFVNLDATGQPILTSSENARLIDDFFSQEENSRQTINQTTDNNDLDSNEEDKRSDSMPSQEMHDMQHSEKVLFNSYLLCNYYCHDFSIMN